MNSYPDDYLEFCHSVEVPIHTIRNSDAYVRGYKYRVESPYTKSETIQSWEFISGPYTLTGTVINRSLKLHLPLHNLESGCKELENFMCMSYCHLEIIFYKNTQSLMYKISRLTVVSREAKKGQSDCQKQNVRRTTVCLLHEHTFLSFDVTITVNISRAASTFKPAL